MEGGLLLYPAADHNTVHLTVIREVILWFCVVFSTCVLFHDKGLKWSDSQKLDNWILWVLDQCHVPLSTDMTVSLEQLLQGPLTLNSGATPIQRV